MDPSYQEVLSNLSLEIDVLYRQHALLELTKKPTPAQTLELGALLAPIPKLEEDWNSI